MVKFIKNYGVYIAECILFFIFCVIVYYAFWFVCLIDDACFARNFVEIV